MSERSVIATTINGEPTELRADPGAPLVHVLREDARLRASHVGCGNGDCGACTVLIDGEPYKSCLVPAARIAGKRVETLEGLSPRGELHPVQKAFWDHNAFQCGFCLAGQVLCTVALLRKKQNPTRGDIEEALAGNLCRCTGYQQIVTAALSLSSDPHR